MVGTGKSSQNLTLDSARREALLGAFIEWLADYRTDLGIALPFEYLVTVGRRR